MLKKCVKGYIEFMAVCYMVYGISDVVLRYSYAKLGAKKAMNGPVEDFSEPKIEHVSILALKNFKEFGKNMMEYVKEES
jgi:hypothetical protein